VDFEHNGKEVVEEDPNRSSRSRVARVQKFSANICSLAPPDTLHSGAGIPQRFSPVPSIGSFTSDGTIRSGATGNCRNASCWSSPHEHSVSARLRLRIYGRHERNDLLLAGSIALIRVTRKRRRRCPKTPAAKSALACAPDQSPTGGFARGSVDLRTQPALDAAYAAARDRWILARASVPC
jgi:hypothetical protein